MTRAGAVLAALIEAVYILLPRRVTLIFGPWINPNGIRPGKLLTPLLLDRAVCEASGPQK